ncbi:MAG TPA: nuclear transport factor 2 family protein [Microthrixaceae bacterium]|nr:nuclear transport factor 2 family protein [Microthrixaceae bacterium]RTL09766.1 MAG: nuclear transport factor 2 family protein [Acidimicrobiia bacterium]MCB9401796.1 nuclear transport factor 2 family protein [Microthrixaceae bacterium]MCC6183991.1 nuclear transport factor 2 family protein [Microthrixaceae bacterium]MCO5306564.1 nuclear transport factor 2 family protein [Microthrixaceae bacterium]
MTLAADDIIAIEQLYAAYNHLIDGGRAEEWAALFVEEGTLDTGMGIFVEGSTEARVEFAAGVPLIMPGSRHVATNVRILGDGDTATGAAYLQLWVADEATGGVKVMLSGLYQDTLRKVDGTWRFVTRKMVPDAGGPVPIA